jgi:hypothetical protein
MERKWKWYEGRREDLRIHNQIFNMRGVRLVFELGIEKDLKFNWWKILSVLESLKQEIKIVEQFNALEIRRKSKLT